MGDKKIINESLGPDTAVIENWAYARCKNLREISIPRGCVVADNAFEGCDSLSSVYLYGPDDTPGDEASFRLHTLLAMCIQAWSVETGLLIDEAADEERFLKYFDRRMLLFTHEKDDEGFVPFLAGGEEDYEDEEKLRQIYARRRCCLKISMIYERALINRDIPAEFTDFLTKNNPDPAFTILKSDLEHRTACRDLYFEYGLNLKVSTDELLRLSEGDPVLRAYVLNHSESGSYDSFLNDPI